MSSDETPNAPAPRDRRDAVREKAQQVRVRQSRARIARSVALASVVVAVVAAGAVGVTYAVSSSASKPTLSPENVSGDGFTVSAVAGVSMVAEDAGVADALAGAATATPTPEADAEETVEPTPEATARPAVDIRVYVDYLSTGSREFQLANVQQLSQWVEDGAAELTYYPVAMLTAKSNGTKYSLRAAGAAACVATHSPDAFFAFNQTLLNQQPNVEEDGYTDDELAVIAQASGVERPSVVRECIEEQSFVSWANSATERALEGLPDTDGVALTGTPTILVNGTPYVGALTDPKEFSQFVLTVASDTYYREAATPSPTPTSSGTPTP
ncbi:thioredoxin domain-containing protein [Microbacterium chocolatum]|uniref:DsbA family protein n=1 Tax=Microbacterium aurantiacum TaxID=162393 RepID=UPI00338F735D